MKTEKELRELDAWIHANVFQETRLYGIMKEGFYYKQNCCGYVQLPQFAGRFTLEEANRHATKSTPEVKAVILPIPNYTTDPAAAMEVLKKCAQKLGSCEQIGVRWDDGQWVVGQEAGTIGFIDESIVSAETLELAIAKFSEGIFEDFV